MLNFFCHMQIIIIIIIIIISFNLFMLFYHFWWFRIVHMIIYVNKLEIHTQTYLYLLLLHDKSQAFIFDTWKICTNIHNRAARTLGENKIIHTFVYICFPHIAQPFSGFTYAQQICIFKINTDKFNTFGQNKGRTTKTQLWTFQFNLILKSNKLCAVWAA